MNPGASQPTFFKEFESPFADPPMNDYRVKGAVFGTSLDKVERDNIYMLYEGRHNFIRLPAFPPLSGRSLYGGRIQVEFPSPG